MSHVTIVTGKKEAGTRGKYAEDKCRTELEKWSANDAGFDYKRNYDARSSMGRIPKQAGDYEYFFCEVPDDSLLIAPRKRGHGLIEVKQVAHDFRLPNKNFNPDGWGMLRRREMAGGKIVPIIYHSTTKKWRYVPFGWFLAMGPKPSWDLSVWPQFNTVGEALVAAKLFK